MSEIRTMRDVFIENVCGRMSTDDRIFFLSADFGSPKLDKLREDFGDRFINVGIAEQNLVNVATGLALEGYTVYAYAIAPFLTMRAFEQIRNNLSLLSHTREVNVNVVGVGAGLSYDVSGPTHHCLEDLVIMRALPRMHVFSPSDWVLAKKFVDYSISVKGPKYLRFDAKPLPNIYDETSEVDLGRGFHELSSGEGICLVATGFMTHKALKVVEKLKSHGRSVGLIDMFLLKPVDEDALFGALTKYKALLTLEEAFVDKGGLDGLVSSLLRRRNSDIKLRCLGLKDEYSFSQGSREYIHRLNGLDEENIMNNILGPAES